MLDILGGATMSPVEAMKVIEALANGIDPETGEALPGHSPLNSPNVIRALFVAGQALEKAVKRSEPDSFLPANAGRSWSSEEDQALLDMFNSGAPVNELAAKHGRTQGAIASRLARLGRINDRAEIHGSAGHIIGPAAVR
jgi:hypothetical protein